MSFFRAWAWKRENKAFKDRYEKPYNFPLQDDNKIIIRQDKRIASTVWDSVSTIDVAD